MDDLTLAIIDGFQHGLPICANPWQAIAEQLGCSEQQVLQRLQQLEQQGALSRVGPVFEHSRAGASTLAALAVPPGRIEEVAAQINALPEVNHNYQREHQWNLWFVLTAPDQTHLQRVLEGIRRDIDLPLLDLPMLTGYRIDLGFPLGQRSRVPV